MTPPACKKVDLPIGLPSSSKSTITIKIVLVDFTNSATRNIFLIATVPCPLLLFPCRGDVNTRCVSFCNVSCVFGRLGALVRLALVVLGVAWTVSGCEGASSALSILTFLVFLDEVAVPFFRFGAFVLEGLSILYWRGLLRYLRKRSTNTFLCKLLSWVVAVVGKAHEMFNDKSSFLTVEMLTLNMFANVGVSGIKETIGFRLIHGHVLCWTKYQRTLASSPFLTLVGSFRPSWRSRPMKNLPVRKRPVKPKCVSVCSVRLSYRLPCCAFGRSFRPRQFLPMNFVALSTQC